MSSSAVETKAGNDHIMLLCDKLAQDNEQHRHVFPVDITKASQIKGLPTLILRQLRLLIFYYH